MAKKPTVNVDDEHAKAEIAIERLLVRLEKRTGQKISFVSVDVENFKKPSVEIFLHA